jgi:Glucose / Sorbosone dehydrogenase
MAAKNIIGRLCLQCRVALFTLLWIVLGVIKPVLSQEYPPGPQINKDGTAVLVQDYASLPLSTARKEVAPYPPPVDYSVQLGRPTSFHSEPANAPLANKRFFVVDQNGVLYVLDEATRKFAPYLDLGRIYPRFISEPPFGMGFVSLAFDPNYARNGKFYTVHTEKVSMSGSRQPDNAALPGLDLNGFKTTEAINPPAGDVGFECVVTEWTDTNIKNATFEGRSREVLRSGTNFSIHPMGDMIFNPLARPGGPDYGNLYIGIGDGAAGERPGPTHNLPQRLDALAGKIIRITPDATLHPQDMLSSNGQYRIPSTGPDPNPFVSIATARPEIYAYGFRNPHRLSWDTKTNTLIAAEVGLSSWEEVDIITKGSNYGWAEREGPEQVFVGGPNGTKTGSRANPREPFPTSDTLAVDGLPAPVQPLYPVIFYSHQDGNAMGSGYVYRGKLMPQLRGKYVFTDILNGRLFYADFNDMLAARGVHDKFAQVHEIQVVYKAPDASGPPIKRAMYDIVADAFLAKGGKPAPSKRMPDPYSDGARYGGGRADVRLALGGDGELYLLCKTDGWIRKLVAVTTQPPASGTTTQ